VKGYEAFVLGSAVYFGNWLQEARGFVEAHGHELAARPVWLFSSGPIGDPPEPSEEKAVHIEAIREATGAEDHRLFGGKLDKSR